tara:strand:+ start:188 stop:409 length:222 start_codon:yes stop_codon:yes gene_type:complete
MSQYYDTIKEFKRGVVARIGLGRSNFPHESEHFLAGWQWMNARKWMLDDGVDEYLESLGLERQGLIILAAKEV